MLRDHMSIVWLKADEELRNSYEQYIFIEKIGPEVL